MSKENPSLLSNEFLKKYKHIQPNWGFNGLGYVIYKRTYARTILDGDGKIIRTEEWLETVKRCIEGAQNIGASYSKEEAERLFDFIFNLKCSFSGRGLWQLGAKSVDVLGSADMFLNCWVTKISTIEDFCFIFIESMLGGGVGAVISREYIHELPRVKTGVKCIYKNTKDADFIVPDSKEGWCELWRRILEAYLITGKSFSYSSVCIRSSGEPLKTFGGIAPGPKPLVDGIKELCKILENRDNKKLRTQDVADIICCGGQIVKSGGIRRTALILMGDVDDMAFLQLKRWDLGDIPNYRANSNNSLICSNYEHLLERYWDGFKGNGEPYGLVNIKNSKKFGRLGEEKIGDFNLYDDSIIGQNPCAEATLGDKESCVAGETNLITKNGITTIEDAVGSEIEIWNGNRWSIVEPRITGFNQELYRVKFGDGSYLDCTGDHKFSIKHRFQDKYSQVVAKDLMKFSNYSIFSENYKIDYSDGIEMRDAYTLGFTVGDGCVDGRRVFIDLYGEKINCPISGDRALIKSKNKKYNVESQKVTVTRSVDRELVQSLKDDSSSFNEIFSWSRSSILNFIAGIADSDGSATTAGSIRIYISEYQRALKIQLLLTKCGVKSSVNLMQKAGIRTNMGVRARDIYYLQICECKDIPCHRLDCSKGHTGRFKGKNQTIKCVEKLEGLHTVYCFDEPLNHKAVFNNALTFQCNLSELFVNNIESKEEMLECAKLLYKTQKAIAAYHYLHEDTNKIVHKNMRLGLGVTGVCQRLDCIEEWCDFTYKGLRAFDKKYSKEKGYPQSIRLSVVKPSGTLSLLSGSTPGVHPGYSQYHIRRIRFSANDSLIPILREAQYHIEPEIQFDGSINHDILIAEFPCCFDEKTICEDGTTTIEQLDRVKLLQTCWADQAVSNTIYIKKEEINMIKDWLKKNYNSSVKSLSFLLHSGHGFKQAPYEPITKERYLEKKEKIKPINFSSVVDKGNEIQESLECSSGACPIK